MEKLRDTVMKMATEEQKHPLSASQIASVEQKLHTAFPAGLHTPLHPPYAAMIYKAITELSEEGGSTEESISQYIMAKYKDLPFAHKSFLSQHLRKLSHKGFIVFTYGKFYMIRDLNTVSVGKKTRPPIMRKHGMTHVTPPLEEFRVSEENCFENDESMENKGRKGKKSRRELVWDKEDENEVCDAVNTNLSLTGMNVLKQEHYIDGVGSTVVRTKGESSKGLVKRQKKDMIKCMGNALSDHLPDEAEMRQCVTMSQEKLKKQHLRRTGEGNQITDHKDRKHVSFLSLQQLFHTSFFDECKVHSDAEGSKSHSYCLDCFNGPLCNLCQPSHQDHSVIRIYKTMWENVVSASKIQMYIDTSDIQTHFASGRDVISLKRTFRSLRRKNFNGACLICKRLLPESFKFCSLKCKIEHDLASCMPSVTN